MSGTIIKSGAYKVVTSGSVISYESNPIEVEFKVGDKALSFIFSFHKEEGLPQKMEAVLHGENQLELKLINFNRGIDQGNIRPMKVGDADGKDLYLNFRLRSPEASESRTLDFTVYTTL